MFKFILVLTVLFLNTRATFVADLCNGFTTSGNTLKTDCVKTASASGGDKSCCLLTFNAVPKTPHGTTPQTTSADVAVVTASAGSKSDTNYYSCFAAGGQARIKTGAATKGSANTEGIFTASTFCGSDGKTAVTGAQSGKGWSKFNSGTSGAVTAIVGNTGTPAAANRLGIFGTVTSCACGVSTMPTDGCVGLASADVKTKCTATSDGGTPAKKCCLATFAAVPTTPV